MNIQAIARKAVNLAFSLASQLLRPVVFYKVTGYSVDASTGIQTVQLASVPVNALVVYYSSKDINNSSILYGDEKWLVKASDLSTISPDPAADDWFEEVGIRHDIVNALKDASGQLWTFQVRRQIFDPLETVSNSLDLGTILEAHDSSEDLGDLSQHDSEEDMKTATANS